MKSQKINPQLRKLGLFGFVSGGIIHPIVGKSITLCALDKSPLFIFSDGTGFGSFLVFNPNLDVEKSA